MNEKDNLNENINQEQSTNTEFEYKKPEMQVIDSHPQKGVEDKIIEKVENFVNTTDYRNDYETEDVKKNKSNAMICYIPFVVYYFLFTGKYKKSNYLFFHANQGFSVTIIWVISFIISKVLGTLFAIKNLYVTAYIPNWVNAVSYSLYFIALLLSAFGFVNTLNENSKELPVIGKIKLLK